MKKTRRSKTARHSNLTIDIDNCITAENPITLKQLEHELSLHHICPHDIDGDWYDDLGISLNSFDSLAA